jgi:hypothetical protein
MIKKCSNITSVVDPDPPNFDNLDLHADPHTHQIKIRIRIHIRIRIKIYKLDPEPDPDPHQFADVKPKCMEYESILALFKGLHLFLKLESESGSGSASG